jgi:hypothetical protein
MQAWEKGRAATARHEGTWTAIAAGNSDEPQLEIRPDFRQFQWEGVGTQGFEP